MNKSNQRVHLPGKAMEDQNFLVIVVQNKFVRFNYPLVTRLFINRLQIIIFAECG